MTRHELVGRCLRHVRALSRDERGGVSTEYIVILILIAIIGIVAWVERYEAVRNDADEQYQQFGYPPED